MKRMSARFSGNGKLTPEQGEVRRLKARVKQLDPEKRILKEATAFFVKKLSEIFVYYPKKSDDLSRWHYDRLYSCVGYKGLKKVA